MNGGFFGGQINDGGIIYNLIVAPKATGENSSKQYKTSATADTPSALWENPVYGFPASQAGNSGTYPAFQFARGLSISGYNDWYLPAVRELEVLYYFLKPDATLNNTSSGSNPSAVAPEPVSTSYTSGNPAPTSATNFQVGNSEAFALVNYWSSTAAPVPVAETATYQSFSNGLINTFAFPGPGKTASLSVRAIRREYANAPVAIGAAFGGGYFAGQYQDGGVTYNLIVAPVATGQFGGATSTGIQYKTGNSADTDPPSQNEVYGKPATDFFTGSTYPAFNWAKGLTIATFSDWYIPAKNELALLCWNLGPNWTTATDFKTGGAEAFVTTNDYWSSTQDSSLTFGAWMQIFSSGAQNVNGKSSPNGRARVVRRVVA
jgi:hypothetical protein